MSKNVKRLFNETKPSHYDLSIKLDTDKKTFSGAVNIKFQKTGRPSKRVTFHQKDLKIESATLKSLSKNHEIKLSRVNLHGKLDEVRLHSEEMIYPGEYEARLEFFGLITDPMHGLYPCYFTDGDEKKVMFATQFESHHAREVFPCVDEPEAKATFQLKLDTPESLEVLSNTLPDNQKKSAGRRTTVFKKTPVMSSYLLAFVTGELQSVEAKTKSGIIIRTWATVAQPKKFLEYANAEAAKTLEFFTDYFQTPYPLEKCDQVALPDFESGAMENWGLITYREVALLTDPDNRSLSGEQYVSMVVAHELSHQWFGNLVTMKWWDDLWLNESFASMVEHIALNALHPDWHWWEHYVISDVLVAANRDVYKDVQPVGVNVSHPDEIHTLFDPAIVYAKGGRLLKMMYEFIGEEAFRAGLKEYFAKNKYKNATRDDLWQVMSASSKSDVGKLMTPWIEQSGMPVLSAEKKSGAVHVSQERFLLDGQDDKSLWPIALLADRKLPATLFEGRSADIKTEEPVIFNTHGSGHYLVDYKDTSTQTALASAIASQTIPAEGRTIRLNDIILLARAGKTSLTQALDIVSACGNEPRDAVWSMMSRVIGLSKTLVEGDKTTEANIRKFQTSLAASHYKRLGWVEKPGEDPNDTLLRQTMIGIMLGGENSEAIDIATKLYEDSDQIEDLPAELRGIILGTVVKFGEGKEIDKLLQKYASTSNSDLQHSICAGLCSVKDAAAGKKIIKSTIADGGIARPQDMFRWYAYLIRNQHTRKAAWDWLTSDWDRLEKLFGGSKTMDFMPMYSANPLSTPDWEKKYKDFFTPLLKIRSLERNIKIGFAEIAARIEWRNREETKLKQYFK